MGNRKTTSCDRPLFANPLFAGLSSEGLAKLETGARTTSYKRGDLVRDAGDRSADVFVLLDGAVQVELFAASGRVVAFRQLQRGDVSGNSRQSTASRARHHQARVIGDGGVTAGVVLAMRHTAGEGRRPAGLDGNDHLQLAKAYMAAIGGPPSGTMAAEDIRVDSGQTSSLECAALPPKDLGKRSTLMPPQQPPSPPRPAGSRGSSAGRRGRGQSRYQR